MDEVTDRCKGGDGGVHGFLTSSRPVRFTTVVKEVLGPENRTHDFDHNKHDVVERNGKQFLLLFNFNARIRIVNEVS